MKTLPSCLIALALPFAALAQTGAPSGGGNQGSAPTPGAGSNQGTTKNAGESAPMQNVEGVVKRGPRLVLMRGGQVTFVDQPMTMANGLRVDADGTITRPDRTQATLRENEMVTLAGMIVPLPPGTPTGSVSSGSNTQATKTAAEASAAPVKAGETSNPKR